MREYALERLVAAGEEVAVRRRHLAYFLALAEEAEPQLQGAEQPVWMKRLSDERDNLRAALHGAHGMGDLAQGLRLASALWQFWYTHGYLREGRRWMESLLELEAVVGTPESHALRAQACVRAAILAAETGDHSQAAALAEEGLALYRTTQDKRGMGVAWNVLGNVAKYQGDLERAAEFYEQSMAVALRTIARLPLPPIDRIRRETLVRALQDQLGASPPTAAPDAGMTLHQTVDFCLDDESGSHAPAGSLS